MLDADTHVARLTRWLSLERQAERARLEQDRASLPLGELEARGLVVLDLESREERIGLGGRSLVTFARGDRRPLTTRLGAGDLVSVSPRKAPVDAPPSGTVTRASRTEVEVAFERPPPPWVGEGRLRLDLLSNDVTWDRLRAGVTAFGAMTHGQAFDRREVLLGRTPPRFETAKPVEPSRPLNEAQAQAVALALSARDFALVHGPPGTGKSTVLAEVASQWVAAGKTVLCTAASNAAVDHLLELCLDAGLRAVRVGHPARVLPHLQQHTLDLRVEEHPDRVVARDLFDDAFELLGYARRQRSQGRSRARFANAREAQAEARRLMDEARKLERRAVASVLDGADVLCATLAMLDSSLLSGRRFDAALVDEATQATEPLTLLAFHKAPTVVLAGDPQQLPPTVLSLEAQKEGYGVSLFERLLAAHGEGVKRLLVVQHRMHEALMRFPSDELYQGRLVAHEAVRARTLDDVLPAGRARVAGDAPLEGRLDAPPLLFVDTAGKGFDEARGEGTASLSNEGEAELLERRARALVRAGLAPAELAVITPYRAQALHLRERLGDLEAVEVDTVDAFQGREKDAVLVSLVRSNGEQQLGFLEDLRRMNVALTRARRHLFVVGDSATLTAHPFYARLVERAQAVGGYRSAWEFEDPAG